MLMADISGAYRAPLDYAKQQNALAEAAALQEQMAAQQNALMKAYLDAQQYNAMAQYGGPTNAAASALNGNSWMSYTNQKAIRNKPINGKLQNAMSFLPGMGLRMEVFPGGQDATGPRRTGSHRHDNGGAADVLFYRGNQMLDWANPSDLPVFQEIVRRARANGITGIGAGPGYMRRGSMHIGYGPTAVWGADGKGVNAPAWLRQAFNT